MVKLTGTLLVQVWIKPPAFALRVYAITRHQQSRERSVVCALKAKHEKPTSRGRSNGDPSQPRRYSLPSDFSQIQNLFLPCARVYLLLRTL
ncbi:uncharacterized protein BDZ83DRAFT_612699 [Colletotrichum acutatum]|uniref:Uncharacterized protein n=1 Tax=Glomerella acutata TaxID=27357 RepID=A0AAD8UTC8_GLOAC|nr:uncharacterized protein BDZ83DRAFT_612699 [Colletotrichum acutatum]KAK1727414.1 hypothetical protein BDZ83DRAFT_612699 [Colletotrichum acutatum]